MKILGSRSALATCTGFANTDHTDFVTVAILTVYLLLGPFQHFPPPGWVDPGFYIGYFRHLELLVDRFGTTYFVNRWPLILLGWAFYHTLSLQLANAALATTWYVATLLALRSILRPAFSASARKLVLVLYGCSPLVVASVARTYADGPAIAFLMLAIALAWTGIMGTPSKSRLFAAGALAVIAMLTQPGSLFAFLPMTLTLLLLDRRPVVSWLPTALIWGLCGGVVALAAYIAVVFAITGTPDLFGPILLTGNQVIHGLALNYREPLLAWIFPTTRLSFVMLTLAVGLWTAWSGRISTVAPPLWRIFLWSLLSEIGSLLFLFLSDAFVGSSMLQFSFYASYLLPTTYLLFGSILVVWSSHLSQNGRLVILAIAVIMSTLVVIVLMATTADIPPSAALFPILVSGCAMVAVLAAFWGTKTRSVWPSIALLAALCPLAAVSVDTRHVFRGQASAFGDTYDVLNRAANVIDNVALKRPILFWFDRDGFNHEVTRPPGWSTPYRQVYPLRFGPARYDLNALDSLNAFYLWDRSRLNDHMPALSPAEITMLRDIGYLLSIVVVSYRNDDIDRAVEALKQAGIGFQQQDRHLIQGKALTLYVAILNVGG